MTPNPNRFERDDTLGAAGESLARASAMLAARFLTRRGDDVPDAYAEYVQERVLDVLEEAVLGLAVETPAEWAREEALDAAIERGAA